MVKFLVATLLLIVVFKMFASPSFFMWEGGHGIFFGLILEVIPQGFVSEFFLLGLALFYTNLKYGF